MGTLPHPKRHALACAPLLPPKHLRRAPRQEHPLGLDARHWHRPCLRLASPPPPGEGRALALGAPQEGPAPEQEDCLALDWVFLGYPSVRLPGQGRSRCCRLVGRLPVPQASPHWQLLSLSDPPFPQVLWLADR
eukprot:4272294-Amphidinium_carterae.1